MLNLQGDLVSMIPDVSLSVFSCECCDTSNKMSFIMFIIMLSVTVCVSPVRLRGRRGSVWRLRGKNRRISFSSWRHSWMIWSASPTRRAATTRCRSLSSWRGRRWVTGCLISRQSSCLFDCFLSWRNNYNIPNERPNRYNIQACVKSKWSRRACLLCWAQYVVFTCFRSGETSLLLKCFRL